MRTEITSRIWLDPPRYWAATKGMTQKQSEEFMERLWSLAERKQFDELRNYDCISIDAEDEQAA